MGDNVVIEDNHGHSRPLSQLHSLQMQMATGMKEATSKADLSTFIIFSHLFVFSMTALIYGMCCMVDYMTSPAAKNSDDLMDYKEFSHTSEIEFEFVSTYESKDIKEMMDLEFNSKNSKGQIKQTLNKVLKKKF